MEGKICGFYNKKKPKAQMWVIVEVITFGLNPIVLACVMN
jgi:hypothetical protein